MFAPASRLAAATFLLVLSPAGAAQDERTADGTGEPAAALRPMRFDDLYGAKRLDLTGDAPGGLRWADATRLLVPANEGAPQIVDAATGAAAPAYDAAALSAALTAAGVDGRFAKSFARRPASLADSLDQERRRALLRSGGDLFAVDFGGPAFGADSDVAPVAVRLTETPRPEELPELSPDGRTAAFVRDYDLFAVPLIGAGDAVHAGPAVRLTVGGGDLIRHGKADWVYFEELYDRSWKGYRWSPDSRRIAVMEYDDRAVGAFTVLDQAAPVNLAARPADSGQRVERTRYPKTGTTNPTVRLGVVEATGGPVRWIDWATDTLPGLPAMGRAPGDGGGLIAHFGWFPDGTRLYGYLQDRVQSTLSVRAVDVPPHDPSGRNPSAGRWNC